MPLLLPVELEDYGGDDEEGEGAGRTGVRGGSSSSRGVAPLAAPPMTSAQLVQALRAGGGGGGGGSLGELSILGIVEERPPSSAAAPQSGG
jgi:hypothetical protein